MSIPQAALLGFIQGATEFLPISSSGHLVLIPWLLGWEFEPQFAFIFDVLVQWGTILSLVIYFGKDLYRLVQAPLQRLRSRPYEELDMRLALLIAYATIPAVVLGLLLKEIVESTFSSHLAVFAFLVVTALLLFIGERLGKQENRIRELSNTNAVIIGCFQALALFPGISRSGSTISGGMLRGLKRPDAARFAFLMAIPAMLGAGLVALIDLSMLERPFTHFGPLAVGFLVAFLIGLGAIHVLLRFLERNSLRIFMLYCLGIGIGGLLLNAFAS